MKFKMIADEVKDDNRATLERMISWINDDSDENNSGLRHFSTNRRWEQYQNGEISKEKAKEFAIKRATKYYDKDLEEDLEKLERVSNAKIPNHIDIDVSWSRGYNATATVYANGKETTGHAGGWGYDKRSSAIGSALNENDGILNALYSYKESQLENGKTDDGGLGNRELRDNRDIICYGSGYGAMPYFEGGVGSECHWKMFDLMGYDVHCFENAKYNDYYSIDKRN